jgi:hypothetical protein
MRPNKIYATESPFLIRKNGKKSRGFTTSDADFSFSYVKFFSFLCVFNFS